MDDYVFVFKAEGDETCQIPEVLNQKERTDTLKALYIVVIFALKKIVGLD